MSPSLINNFIAKLEQYVKTQPALVIWRIIMKWEYKTIKLKTRGFLGGNFDERALDNMMNEYGSRGWELVAGFDTNKSYGESRDVVVIFKRQIA